MSVLKDPKGNRLKLVMLQVMSKDERGPLDLRVRHDDETIGLTAADISKTVETPTFLLVWTPENQALGETRIPELMEDLDGVRRQLLDNESARVEMTRLVGCLEHDLDALEADNKTKTEALRTLQRERDPDRVDRLIAARVADATAALERDLASAKQVIEAGLREIAELKASKRRLRDALDRLKEQ